MDIIPISAFSDNYIWAVIDKKNKVFDCVDPGEAHPVLEFAKQSQLELRSILVTHHHHDHIGGVKGLLQYYPSCTVYGPLDSRIATNTKTVVKDQRIHLGKHVFRVLTTPGHTSSHVSYFEEKHHWLFCGDTLFSAGCGRVFDGSLEELYQSLVLFKSLPKATLIFCAHEYTQQNLKFAHTVEPSNKEVINYLLRLQERPLRCTLPSSLEQELLINPFLRTEIRAVKQYAKQYGASNTRPLEVFRVLREQKNLFS